MDLLCAAIGYLAVCISTCGSQAASFKTRHLMYSSSAVSWNTAYATCSHMKGHLITVDNNITINALKYIFAQPEAAAISNTIWMGLHNTAPTSDVPEYVWTDCTHLDVNSTMWRRGEPNFVQTDRCIVTTFGFRWLTKPCNQTRSFFCENVANVDCIFEKDTGKECGMDGVLLSKKMAEEACATRCQEDMDGSDICWAYEYNITFRQCSLLFGSDPYMCETLQANRGLTTGRRRCFRFVNITGSEVPGHADLFPNCSTTEVTASTETPATASIISTTVEAVISTLAMTTTTPSTTVTTPTTLETTTSTTLSTATSTSAVTISAVTSSVTPTVTTTTTSSPTAATTTTVRTTATSDTDTPTSTPVPSTTSPTAPSGNASATSFSPFSGTTFMSRPEAALTSPRSAPTPTTVTSPGRYVYEACVAVQTFTILERKKRTDDIVTDLTLDKKNLSSYRRKKSSAEDERPSAQRVGGGVAIILLVTAGLIIILPDCASILMHVMHIHKKKRLGPTQQ